MRRRKDIFAASISVQQKDTFLPPGEDKNATAFSPPTNPRSLNPVPPFLPGFASISARTLIAFLHWRPFFSLSFESK